MPVADVFPPMLTLYDAVLAENKYSSFQRQLNLYGFRKLVRGNEAGGYMHPLFERGKPEQLSQVRRGFFPEVGRVSVSAGGGSWWFVKIHER